MPKEPNKPIGEVTCPHRTCDLKASVYKFRTRATQVWAQRRAGKLYSACRAGHRCEDQDYLLEHATIWGAERSGASAPEADESAPVRTPEKPASAPVPEATERTQSTPVIAPAQERKKTSWGWFT